MVRPLDIVRTPEGAIALVTEVDKDAAIDFIHRPKGNYEKSAWWDVKELTVLGSLPVILANAVAHNMGMNQSQGQKFFGVKSGRQSR